MPGHPVYHQLLELAQTYIHWVDDAIQLSHPLLSPFFLTSIFPSIQVFSNESVLCIRWSKYWSFSFSLSPPNEYSGLISFRMDWLDLLAYHLKLCTLWPAFSYTLPLWCWWRLLRVPWTARRSNQSILKEISPEYSLEGLMLKLQYFGHLMQRTDSLEKTLMLGKTEGRRRGDNRRWDGWIASLTQWI